MTRVRRVVRLVAVLCASALLFACGGLQPEDPGLALRQGGQATGTLKTVNATMKVTKGTISFQGFSLVSATAALRLPDESDTTYLVRQQDLQLGLEVVIISGHAYLKPPLLRFTELTPQQAADIPDLARLFDPVHGLPAVIPAGRNPQYEGVETVDGVDCHRVSALYTAEQINGLLPQLSSQGDVTANIWVGGSDHFIRKAVLGGNFGDNGALSTVEVDLSNFNGSVSIASPGRTS
jgi:LppX/LprAFG-like lipoprotein